MYLIVVGAGRIGTEFIEQATAGGNDVVVVESNSEVANRIASDFDCLVLNDDGTDPDVLEDAGIDEADAIISTTNHDAVNTLVMLQADDYEVPTRVSVVRDAANIEVFEKIGVDILENPYELIGERLYHDVRYPGIGEFMPVDDAHEFVELRAKDGAPITARSLEAAGRDSILPAGSHVAAIKRDETVVTPSGDVTIQASDVVTVLVNDQTAEQVMNAFGHSVNNA